MTLPVDVTKVKKLFDNPGYTLEEKIGQGGFGQVYRAKQNRTGQWVAIKFMAVNGQLDDIDIERYKERFERETRLCSRLQHPNIVKLLDKGECNGLLFAVFEYIEGQTLKAFLQQQTMLPATGAQIMAQVLDALAHAHQQGVIHRDIKPANIMICQTGATLHAKILDFGIGTLAIEARQLDHKTLTLTQETLGTPAYSAPEQLRGEPPTVKTDIYVWALVFIECLTGQPAVHGANLAAIFHQQLSEANITIPVAIAGHPIAELLRRILNKNAVERPGNTAELYREFTQYNLATLVLGAQTETDNQQNTQAIDVTAATQITTLSASHSGLIEQKQLTTLCVELQIRACEGVEIDLDVADALHQDQLSQCTDIALRYSAYHAGSLAGTLLFYFGYPLSSDSDTRLAARTALEIISKIQQRNMLLKQSQGIEVQVKMAMHSGTITCINDKKPVGQTATMAVELIKHAAPNQILCTETARQQLSSYMHFESGGKVRIGLSTTPTLTHHLTSERQTEAIGFLRGNKTNHKFIGREAQIASLQQLLNNNDSPFKAAHIIGDAGIGKSRLLLEVRNQAIQYTQRVMQCLPEHKNSALYPILALIKQHFKLTNAEGDKSAAKLFSILSDIDSNLGEKAIGLLCSWLNLPSLTQFNAIAFSPQEQKRLLFEALAALMLKDKDTQGSKVLYMLEDCHWSDPTTLEFINFLYRSDTFVNSQARFISSSRLALPDMFDALTINVIQLQRLEANHSHLFISALLGEQAVSRQLMQTIAERTDGIPLFIEEMVEMLKHKGWLDNINGQMDFVDKKVIEDIPTNLRQSLQQKLDTLLYAKETAQLAAAIGRQFDFELLSHASTKDKAQLQTDIQEMLDQQLVYQQRKVTGNHYIFRHALIKDAAYQSITTNNRQMIHLLLAQTISQHFGQLAEDSPHLLGYHWAKARQPIKAGGCYMDAGRKALKTFSHEETIAHFSHGVEQLQLLENQQGLAESQHSQLIEALTGIGQSEVNSGRVDKGRSAYKQAIEYCRESPINEAVLLHKLGSTFDAHHLHQDALNYYQQAEDCLKHLNDSHSNNSLLDIKLNIYSSRVNAFYMLNDQHSIDDNVAKIKALNIGQASPEQKSLYYKVQMHSRLRQSRFALDESTVELAKNALESIMPSKNLQLIADNRFNYAVVLFSNLQYAKARKFIDLATCDARKLNNVMLLARCLTYSTIIYRASGDVSATEKEVKDALQTCQSVGMNDYSASAKANMAWIAFKRGNFIKAEQLADEAMETWSKLSGIFSYPMQWFALLVKLAIAPKPCENMVLRQQSIIKQLLNENQHKLPEVLDNELNAVHKLAATSDPEIRKQAIERVLSAANQLGYL